MSEIFNVLWTLTILLQEIRNVYANHADQENVYMNVSQRFKNVIRLWHWDIAFILFTDVSLWSFKFVLEALK